MTKITVTVYGKKETFKTRKEAINCFVEAAKWCDPRSSEAQRYYNILNQLMDGETECYDERGM